MPPAESLQRIMAPMQARLCGAAPPLPASVEALLTRLRAMLLLAKDEDMLQNSRQEITHTFLKKQAPLPPDLYQRERLQPEAHPLRKTAAIFGGQKNMDRDPAIPHFRRDDGAWFDFTITVFQGPQGLELLAYDFEIRFPSGEPVAFLRFHLNTPANPRPDEMRCHLHANRDDDELSVPAAVASPEELLGLFLYGLRRPLKQRHLKTAGG